MYVENKDIVIIYQNKKSKVKYVKKCERTMI